MPSAGLEQEFFGSGEVFFVASDEPDERGGFGDAGNLPADVLGGAPLIGLVGSAQFGLGIAVGHRFSGEGKLEIVFVEIGFDFFESFGAFAGGAILTKR